MRTQQGWHRCRLLLRTLASPPPENSYREYVLSLADLYDMRSQILAQRTVVTGDNEDYEGFRDSVIPYLGARVAEKNARAQEFLEGMVAKGAVSMRPVAGGGSEDVRRYRVKKSPSSP